MQPPENAAPERARPPADWARAAEGLQLAGIAVFLLLNTLGILPWSFWLDAITLWPVLIMSAGLRVAFERSRVPWLLLLGPVLVLGALTWVARGNLPSAPRGPWTAQSVERPPDVSGVRLEAVLPGARLDVKTRPLPPDRLLEGRSASRHEQAHLESERDGETAVVKLLGGRQQGLAFLPGRREDWEMTLPADLPITVDLRGAMLRNRLDLASGRVAGLVTHGVFIGSEVRLPRPDRTVTIAVQGVFNALSLVVPAGTPVRVQGPRLPFNVRAAGTSTEPSPENPGYDVRLNGIFNVLTIDSSPAHTPPGPTPPPEARPSPHEAPSAEAPPPSGAAG